MRFKFIAIKEMTKVLVAQVFSVMIFVVMFLVIISEKVERHIVTLLSAALMLIVVFGLCMHSFTAINEVLNLGSFAKLNFWYQSGQAHEESSGINWATIVFIMGMMVMVEGMGESGFFRWLCLGIAKLVKYRATSILITFMIMSLVLAMFIDSITVILFLAAVTLELAKLLKFNPVPLIMAEIFCANLGGSATMCGDPPNIIIGTSLGYSFFDFIMNTGFIALVSAIFVIVYYYICFRKPLKESEKSRGKAVYPQPSEAIKSKGEFLASTFIFLAAVVLLVTHAQTGLTVAAIGVIVTIATLIFAGKKSIMLIKKIDYKTLLFFIGLFVVVGGLEQTKILELLADLIVSICGDNKFLIVGIIIWASGIASALVDNIPFAATMIPVISSLSATTGIDLGTLSWSLAMGTDVGGSATPIGASANVVGISAAAQEGHFIGWGKYCKYAIPATFIVLVISTAIIYVRYL